MMGERREYGKWQSMAKEAFVPTQSTIGNSVFGGHRTLHQPYAMLNQLAQQAARSRKPWRGVMDLLLDLIGCIAS